MITSYRAIGWNAFRKRYDLVLSVVIVAFLTVFVVVGKWLHPSMQPTNLLIRATAVAGFALLHFVLAIGPMARLDRRWLPVLYNRRHLGVAT